MKTDRVIQIANFIHTGNFSNPQRGRIYSASGISPCLDTASGGGLQPKIVVEEQTPKQPSPYKPHKTHSK